MSIILWGYQFDAFLNLFDPLFNFKGNIRILTYKPKERKIQFSNKQVITYSKHTHCWFHKNTRSN